MFLNNIFRKIIELSLIAINGDLAYKFLGPQPVLDTKEGEESKPPLMIVLQLVPRSACNPPWSP